MTDEKHRPYDPDAVALDAAATQFEEMGLDPFDPSKPRGLQGAGEAAKGLLQPAAEMGRTFFMTGVPIVQAIEQAGDLGERVGFQSLPDEERQHREEIGLNPRHVEVTDWYFKNVVDDLGSNAIESWRPDVTAMGGTARVLGTVGTAAGQTLNAITMPSAFLVNSAVSPTTDLVRQGVDVKTASTVGAVNLAVNAAGLRLPAAFGSTLPTRLATGAGSNVVLGVAADASSSGILEAGGYEEQASGYNATDPYARGLDVLMGLAFGAKAHIDAPRLTPSQRDAVLTANNADHFTRATMPGEPQQPGADVRHQDALATAMRQIFTGDSVSVTDIVRAEDFILRSELQTPAPSLMTPMPSAIPAGYPAYRRALESGGVADAKNPRSSAYGADQFTAATWRKTVAKAKPAWADGMTDAQLLAARVDPAKSAEMATALDVENATSLQAAGLPVTMETLYASHHFGINRAKQFARAADATPMELILSKGQIEANPYLAGKTKAEAIADWTRRAEKADVAPRQPAGIQDTVRAVSEPAAPARPAFDLPEAGRLIDQRLATLDELASQNRLDDGEFKALQQEDIQLVDLLRRSERVQRDGVVPADPRDRLTGEQIDAASQRRAEIRQGLEQHRAAVGYEQQATQLRSRLDRIDRDADLVRLAERIRGEDAPQIDAARQAEPVGRQTAVAEPMRAQAVVVDTTPAVRAVKAVEAPQRPVQPQEPLGAVGAGSRAAARIAKQAAPDGEPAARADVGAIPVAPEMVDTLRGDAAATGTKRAAETVGAARTVIEQAPDLMVPTGMIDEAGNPVFVSAAEAMAQAELDVQRAEIEIQATQAAANCFLRTAQ